MAVLPAGWRRASARQVLRGAAALVAAVAVWHGARADAGPREEYFSRRARYAVAADSLYKSPIELALTRDGRRLFVACENTDQVLVVDTGRGRVRDSVAVGREPLGLALSPDERRLYVAHRWDNDVAQIDLASMRVEKRIAVGDDPHQVAVGADGRRLFVANTGTHTLSVVDLEAGVQARLLRASMAPFGLAFAPGGARLYVSHLYSRPVPFRTPPILELSVVDAAGLSVCERRDLDNAVIGQSLAVSPDGSFVVTAIELPRNLIPETQVYQGWMVTYGFALTETRPGGRSAYLLIDEPNLYFADPYGVAFTPDGGRLLISSSGADHVSIIDMEAVHRLLRVQDGRIGATDAEIARLARHLGASDEYVLARVPTGANPKGLVVSADGRRAYVACRLADRIDVIDIPGARLAGSVPLGGPEVVTLIRWGAQLFNYASISFQRQMSCATCHPEHGVDGLLYDIAVDGGMGHNLVDNLTMRGIGDTAPFKWTGKNPTLERQEGPRAAQLFFRTHGFTADENRAMVAFIESLRARPNRYRGAGGNLGKAQEWGRRMFERAYDKMGRYIPVANRCVTCHPEPYGTDRRQHDVGTRGYHDRDGRFDTPHLLNVYERPPYLHDGRCYSLEEIWTVNNPDDLHGVSNEMMKEDLNALIEYLKTF